jgi:hypothetical protein
MKDLEHTLATYVSMKYMQHPDKTVTTCNMKTLTAT